MAARYDAYVLCTSPRSGSTLLCKLLTATGCAGCPASYFHRPSIADWATSVDLPPPAPEADEREALAAIFRAVVVAGSGTTGVFGLRLQRHSFGYFMAKLALLHPDAADDAARFRAAFGRVLFVHLTRGDKIAQAISYVKAEQTGLWHMAPDGTELERLAPPRAPIYDAAAIRASVATMTAYDRDWAAWFEMAGVAPMRLTYDALSADPVDTVAQVLDRLGLDRGAAAGITPGVKKLSDGTNEAWAARFRAEAGAT